MNVFFKINSSLFKKRYQNIFNKNIESYNKNRKNC